MERKERSGTDDSVGFFEEFVCGVGASAGRGIEARVVRFEQFGEERSEICHDFAGAWRFW